MLEAHSWWGQDSPIDGIHDGRFVIKSNLESCCKRFRKSAIQENLNLKPETQIKKKLIPKNKATIFINTMK